MSEYANVPMKKRSNSQIYSLAYWHIGTLLIVNWHIVNCPLFNSLFINMK